MLHFYYIPTSGLTHFEFYPVIKDTLSLFTPLRHAWKVVRNNHNDKQAFPQWQLNSNPERKTHQLKRRVCTAVLLWAWKTFFLHERQDVWSQRVEHIISCDYWLILCHQEQFVSSNKFEAFNVILHHLHLLFFLYRFWCAGKEKVR